MADYRLSAQVIKRSNGRSAVAAAAYRAAMRLDDERTGEIHNYERKRGVVHAEILAPDNTPDWMLERQKLWNAVEITEKRKDAQLARELQLSLPHELTDEQRKELVQGFVHEQFVSRGMIADVAIHHPDKRSDSRNHHAHIMLTMRDLTASGFGQKNRDWNSPELLEKWRERWAHHQNRALENNGHEARVDHRSYEKRGIDQEPTHHLGKTAHNMETRGKRSRIGNQNREVDSANAERARWIATRAQVQAHISYETQKINQRAENTIEAAQHRHIKTSEDLRARQLAERENLERILALQNSKLRESITGQLERVSHRLDNAKGFKKTVRDLLGLSHHDEKTRDQLGQSLKALNESEALQRRTVEDRQREEQRQLQERQTQQRDQVQRQAIAEAQRTMREMGLKRPEKPAQPANDFRRSNIPAEPENAPDAPTSEPVPDLDAPSMDDLKNTPDVYLSDDAKPERPSWANDLFGRGDDDRHPWRSDFSRSKEDRDKPREKTTPDRTPE